MNGNLSLMLRLKGHLEPTDLKCTDARNVDMLEGIKVIEKVIEMNEPKTQREWYEYYKHIVDQHNHQKLFLEVIENPKLQPFVKSLVVEMMKIACQPVGETVKQYYLRQLDIMLTKYLHGFNVTDIQAEISYLQGEVDEVKQAINCNEGEGRIVEELADVVIYCYGMAQILHMDLDTAIFNKMKYNESRKYPTDLEG